MTTTRYQTKHLLNTDGLEVATVRYQGGWCVRLQHSPDEISLQRVATLEYAEVLAARHAARF